MARQWNEALKLLQSSQCQSDDWCLSAAIWACQVAGATDAASALLSQRLEQERGSRRKRKELRLLEHLEQTAVRNCPASVIHSLEQFSTENSWLKVAGGEKAKVLQAVVRPTDRVLEIGAYVGYSALRLSLLQDGRQQVRAIESDPLNAAVAQEVLHLAGATESVQLRVGRACDWLASGCLDPVDVLILDHRGTVYHEDLTSAEPLLNEGARVLADNVLHPGAPMFLLAVQDRYEVEVHVLQEFGMPEVEDWLLVCTPKTWPVAPSDSDYASLKFADMRRWAVEVNRLCHESQTGYVEWRSLQSRMRPVLMARLATLQGRPHPQKSDRARCRFSMFAERSVAAAWIWRLFCIWCKVWRFFGIGFGIYLESKLAFLVVSAFKLESRLGILESLRVQIGIPLHGDV
eukprot:s2988_g1.t1